MEEVADELDIPHDHMFSNRLLFHYNCTFYYTLLASYCFHVKAFFVPQFIYYNQNIHVCLCLCFVTFCISGSYAGIILNQSTSRTGGKVEAISNIRQSLGQNVSITYIGGGIDGLDATTTADNFIGYGGNGINYELRTRSQFFITDFKQLYRGL